MIKVFMTGDNHFGKKYDRYPEIRERLIQSRFDCLEDMVIQAEKENCDLFIITGDLFDNVSSISTETIRKVADILRKFDGRVLVLPGNHDYYSGDEKVWKDFKKVTEYEDNIHLLNEMKPMKLPIRDEAVIIYPAYCQSKHAMENNLGWIKGLKMSEDAYHLGIAHGAVEGKTPDINGEYFLMTELELNTIPVDAWLIGHTHVPFPALSENKETEGYKVFNAGTHEQTDLHNNTEGFGFILTFDRKNGKKTVSAHSYRSGRIRFYDLDITPKSGESLEDAVKDAVSDLQSESIIRIKLHGAVSETDYEDKDRICRFLLKEFLVYEVDSTDLRERITPEKIYDEFSEIGFAAALLKELLDKPKELQMAYELLKKYQN